MTMHAPSAGLSSLASLLTRFLFLTRGNLVLAGDAMTRLRRLSDPCFERVSNSMILLLFKKSNAENKDFQMKIGVQFTSQL